VNIDKYGQISISEQEAFEALYSGKIKTLDSVRVNGDITQYNQARLLNADRISELLAPEDFSGTSIEFFDESNQCDWFMPEEYQSFPIADWLLEQCQTDNERNRVSQELELFIQHGMFDLLFYLKYLVDTMRENKIVWGVGRGSSVASYVLYLIGVHRINSIKYNLDINEFLKEN
jgi:DNA polymerase III alpha subunit